MRDQTARTSFPPRNIGKYEVRRLLGEGSMGMVFEAWDPTLERDVAIKVMAGASLCDDTMRQRFEREAKAVAKLKHQNIVTIHDLGKDAAGSPFIAMELLEGEDLAAVIESTRNPSLSSKLDVIVQVCRGLEHAHAAGIVHRDIKPANIYVTRDGTAKIMDFGVARWTRASQTQAGIVVGTAGYIAPEQLRGNGVDGRSDLFSLGVVLYEVLTNDLLYSGDTLETIFFKTLTKVTPRLILPDGDELPGLQTILDKALAKEIEDRYPSATEMGRAIETFARSHEGLLSGMTVLKGRSPDTPGRVSFRRSSSQNPTRRVEIPTLSPNPCSSRSGGTLDSTTGSPGPTYTRTSPRPRNHQGGPIGRKRRRMPVFVPPLLVVVAAVVLGGYVAGFQPPWLFGRGSTETNASTNNPDPSQPTSEGLQASGPRPAPAPPDPTSTPDATATVPDPTERVTAIIAEAALAINASDLGSAKALIAEGEALAPGDYRLAKLSEKIRSLEAKARWKQDAAKLVRRAESELAAGDHAAAIESFKQAMEYDPDNADARRGLSRAIESMQAAAKPRPTPPTQPEAERRVVEGRTEFIPAVAADELSGFVHEDDIVVGETVETSPAQVTIELTPTDARPGEPYIVRVRVFNQGYRAIQLNGMELVSQFEDGVSGRGQTLPVRVSRVEPQSTVVVYEASGTWKETQNSGEIEATVQLSGGGRLKKNIRW